MRVAAVAVGDVEVHQPGGGHAAYTRPKVLSMSTFCHSRRCRRVLFEEGLRGGGYKDRGGVGNESVVECIGRGGTVAMCDNCRRRSAVRGANATEWGRGEGALEVAECIVDVVREKVSTTTTGGGAGGLTLRKLSCIPRVKASVKAWWSHKQSSTAVLFLTEYLIVDLICGGVLEITFNFTPYATHCYLNLSLRAVASGCSSWERDRGTFALLPSHPLSSGVVGLTYEWGEHCGDTVVSHVGERGKKKKRIRVDASSGEVGSKRRTRPKTGNSDSDSDVVFDLT